MPRRGDGPGSDQEAPRPRGPAIGIAAAYGVCLGLQRVPEQDAAALLATAGAGRRLPGHQPAHGRQSVLGPGSHAAARQPRPPRQQPAAEIAAGLLAEARAIHEEDRQMCRAIGRHGAELLADGQGVLTHCNAGGLATAEYGTALAVIFAAAESGKRIHVYADETRPLLQGAG